MKSVDWTYDLHILGTRPRNLALEDFGELVSRFADVLGSADQVRFGGLVDGSASIRVRVLEGGTQSVREQLVRVKIGDPAALNKVAKLDAYLAHRGWNAELRNRSGNVVVYFPGALKSAPSQEVRTVQQTDSIIGTVIKIGGRDDTVPMQIQTSDGQYLDVTVRGKDLAKKLGSLLFQEVRISGVATWRRDAEGSWSCVGMVVDDFDRPSAQPLSELFDELGRIPGNEWNSMVDPDSEWMKIRRGDQ